MPKVFISHSWEDNKISKKLAEHLERHGTEIWIDYAKIRGGDSLPDRINGALEWCDTLILVWSETAQSSRYVKLEWENALTLGRRIIPCRLGNTRIPPILSNLLYIDFDDFDTGYSNLLRALGLTQNTEQHSVTGERLATKESLSEPVGHKEIKCPTCGGTMFSARVDSWGGDSDGDFPRYVKGHKCSNCGEEFSW